jgi:hypothetical protein
VDVRSFMDFLHRERQNRRDQVRAETGKDPKTGLTHRPMVLSEEIRPRGGKKSRRRTTLVWEPAAKD